MNAVLVLGMIVLVGALFGRAVIWAGGLRGAIWTGLGLSALGAFLAVRQYMKAQVAPDGWTGIAEGLGAAFIVLALIGYWGMLGALALRRKRK